MSFSAKRCAYSDMPSVSSQCARFCIAPHPQRRSFVLLRRDTRPTLRRELAAKLGTRYCPQGAGEALAELEKAKIPAGSLHATGARGRAHPSGGLAPRHRISWLARPAPLAPTPLDLSETPSRFAHRAPMLGEHTDAVLAELGYPKAAIDGLRAANVI
jgi:crotonobetainyl-CoA:carnitine CoA-transferase CaiB-like acyl-CoA transferase